MALTNPPPVGTVLNAAAVLRLQSPKTALNPVVGFHKFLLLLLPRISSAKILIVVLTLHPKKLAIGIGGGSSSKKVDLDVILRASTLADLHRALTSSESDNLCMCLSRRLSRLSHRFAMRVEFGQVKLAV
jgi:hypothetical protein